MKTKNLLFGILIILFTQGIVLAKPLPPGTGASAPANILIMLDRTNSMLDPLSGKDNKKTGWLKRAMDVAEGSHNGSAYALNDRDHGPSYWLVDQDRFHMNGSKVLADKGVFATKTTNLKFDNPTTMA